ncbi:phosphopantetheine-binding protein, partial [Streptomyces sp. NPDC020965]|uniref:phosphopantetheine-binding protein n=1 Tax=Streptomyces sp. NPDC020965 TaxID=3365105 RepID=UPI0037A78974
VRPLDPEVAVGVLESVSGCVTVVDIDWSRFVPAVTAVRPSPLWNEIVPPGVIAAAGASPSGGLRQRLAEMPVGVRRTAVIDVVRRQVAGVLGFSDPTVIEAGTAFRDLGFDSLTAVELRNALAAEAGLRLPSTLVFDYPTTVVLAEYLLGELADGAADGDRDAGTELDRLEATLLALPSHEVTRMRVATRLQQLMKRLEAAADDSGTGQISAKIEAATSDDIFDLIDNEIGTR